MGKYVEKVGLPGTSYNNSGSSNYAKICNIKTHIANSNPMINKSIFDERSLLYFNVFSFTGNTFSQTNLIVRIKSSETSANSVFWTKKPTTFDIVYVIESDGSYSFYAKCNQNEKVRLQLIEGFDGFVTYYYRTPFNIALNEEDIKRPKLNNEFFGIDGECSIKINNENNGFIIDTVAGGEGFTPSRDGSISLGSQSKRFKGGHFTDNLTFPMKDQYATVNPVNGTTYFHINLKKIVTYYEGKWYCNGEEVTI